MKRYDAEPFRKLCRFLIKTYGLADFFETLRDVVPLEHVLFTSDSDGSFVFFVDGVKDDDT